MDGSEPEQPTPEDDGHGGTPIPHTTWLVDYEGDGRYIIRRYSADGAIDEFIRPNPLSHYLDDQPECCASSHATVYASPGDTIVFSPAFALVYAMKRPAMLTAVLSGCAPRMPRRKHCPHPMWHTEDGVGIMKGNVHIDQHSAFTGAIAVNGFNLGLRGSNCAGTKRRWEWVEPEERRGRTGDN